MRQTQSRLASLLEALANVLSGFLVSWAVWVLVVPLLWPQYESSLGEGFLITSVFTVFSVLRSYAWRRLFENEVHLIIHNLLRRR